MDNIKQELKTYSDSQLKELFDILMSMSNPDSRANDAAAVVAELETRGLN